MSEYDESMVPEQESSEQEDEVVTSQSSHMRTVLQQFSESFLSGVEPVLEPLSKVEQVIARTTDGAGVKVVLPELRDVRHHLRALIEKIREQHAYVLIFGPLKSGKSTLMNSICASYVSEVTALPAYPCLVHVSHSERPQFRVTRYDGTEESFNNQSVLHEVVEGGHAALTKRLREVEETGEEFEPSIHMPSALRRIDVNLPAEELATSGAVLVDTPGLYSRMRFGYDRMTRDFRNAAACAIFVVKSDNLFLEQVFAEFTDLLDLFSRIFLIVNLDSRKSDLAANGELVPSLEREDPNKIIQAFRDLAMSAPLRQAVDDGRLQIYPVDLLNAASVRIRVAAGQDVADARVEDYKRLSDDLTDYLNSSDYLREFLSDSLRRATGLLHDAVCLLEHKTFDELDRQVEVLRGECRKVGETKEAIDRLEAIDWTSREKATRDLMAGELNTQIQEIIKTAKETLKKAVDSWWEDDTSLNDLIKGSLRSHKKRAADQFVLWFKSIVHSEISKGFAGLDTSGQLDSDLKKVGVDLSNIGRSVLAATKLEKEVPGKDPQLNMDEIPVRRGFLDWLLFRSSARIRRLIFGKQESPDKPVSAAVKAKRLREEAREMIEKQSFDDFVSLWSDEIRALPSLYLDAYFKVLNEHLSALFKKLAFETAKKIGRLEEQIHSGAVVTEQVESTIDALDKTEELVEELISKYGVTNVTDEEDDPSVFETGDDVDDDFDESDEEDRNTVE